MDLAQKPPTRRPGSLFQPTASLSTLFKLEPLDAVQVVKRGIPARFLVRISQEMDRPMRQIVRLLGLAQSTAARKIEANATLNVDESERVLGLAKLIGQVQTIVQESGQPEGFNAAHWVSEWLTRPAPALGGKRPDELMDTSEGRRIISELVSRMQSGAYS